MKALRSPVVFSLAALAWTGCASPPAPPPRTLTGDPVVDGQAMVQDAPAKDKTLWRYRTAVTAMRRGQFGVAKPLLDEALLTLGGILGPEASAKKGRSYFAEEAKKTFIGEPYERVMAYVYRGVLYWMDGEPDNARACFRSAQLTDADTENQAYASDYVLLDYMDGLVTRKLSGDGSDAFKRAQGLSKIARLPDYNPKANVLFFVEFGAGPLKYATGQYGQELRFRRGESPVKSALIKTEGLTLPVAACDDLYFQATTRGGRVMDHILANKAVFKSATDAAGDAAILSGAILAGSQQGRRNAGDEAGLALVLAGLASKIISATTTPAADTRCWDNLPQYLSFALLNLPPGPHVVTIEFLNAHGQVLANLTKTVNLTVPEPPREKVIFVSDQSSTPQTL
ncbi:MAG: hypothetical protein HYY24_14475 [Verrucomicrobia bacterium]|nr:hypothetical protein [Verrucomicrobiota bacterium]